MTAAILRVYPSWQSWRCAVCEPMKQNAFAFACKIRGVSPVITDRQTSRAHATGLFFVFAYPSSWGMQYCHANSDADRGAAAPHRDATTSISHPHKHTDPLLVGMCERRGHGAIARRPGD
jgi:hypothetical protein